MKSDRGSAAIEFVVFGLALPALLLTLMLSLANQFRLELAVETAVRQALRSSDSEITVFQRRATDVLADFGVTGAVKVELQCLAECEDKIQFWMGRVMSGGSSASLVLPR